MTGVQTCALPIFTLTIESADRKRIKRVKVSIPEKKHKESEQGKDKSLQLLWIPILFSLFLSACSEDYTPKPRGYFRISLPEKKYTNVSPETCPFTFEIPEYAQSVLDTSPNAQPCWINIEFPQFRGTLYLSYRQLEGNLQQCIEDSRALSMKHIPKSSGIEESDIIIPEQKIYGSYYTVKGNAASALQFYVTDSTRNFIRGSLYFYTLPNPDSIAPVQEFLETDVMHFVNSLHWK